MATLAIMVGIEGSGRARFAREQIGAKGYVVVSSDDVGAEVEASESFQRTITELLSADLVVDDSGNPLSEDAIREAVLPRHTMEEVFRRLRKAIGSGQNAVWDGTNLIRSNRGDRIAMARRWGALRVVCYWMNLPPHRCAANLVNRFITEGRSIDVSFVARKTHERHAEIEKPLMDEGFDEIIEVTEEEYGLLSE